MAIGMIELQGSIARTQDFSVIKQNEDQKGIINQTHSQNQFDKTVNERPHQVNKQDDADFTHRGFDARDKGSNEYTGDGGSGRKKKEPDGRVVLKGQNQGGFDIKI